MVDRQAMAERFVQETVGRRDDVVGVLLCGSSARGEATESSDIDLAVYLKEDSGEGSRDLSRWEEGVFLDCAVRTTKGLGSLEEAMGNVFSASLLKDARILYGPTGFFETLQRQVRGVFMDPDGFARASISHSTISGRA